MNRTDPNAYLNAADDAEMIQLAVDAAAETGEEVVIPRRNERTGRDIWILPRAVKLYTGSSVCLQNCHLRQADDSFDNIFKNSFARTEEGKRPANRQYDIRIYGRGNAVLDGGNHNGLVERNQRKEGRTFVLVNTPIHFVNCERIVVEDLRIIHSRYWGMCFHYCSEGRVSNIQFLSVGNCPNQDGVDLRTGCNNFIIENITGYTQDDTVALTALEGKGLDFLTRVDDMDDSIHNVIIRNITAETVCAQVRLLNNWGKKLYNVVIENIQSPVEYDPRDERSAGLPLRCPLSENYYIDGTTTVVPSDGVNFTDVYWGTFENGNRRAGASVRIGETNYFDPNDPSTMAKLGDCYNITVRNVQSRMLYPVIISRTLADSLIDNVQAFGDATCAVYFDGGEYDNIRVRDVSYSASSRHRETDGGVAAPKSGSRQCREIAPVYFNTGCEAANFSFDGITAAADSDAVFAGDGHAQLIVRDVVTRREDTPLVVGEGIAAKLLS